MPKQSGLWWWSAREYWCAKIDGKRVCLAKGRKQKKAAQAKLERLLAERELLSTTEGPIRVASLCEQFLDDAHRNLAPKTYESYRYPCQLIVDHVGDRLAHTIKPADLRRWQVEVSDRLNETTQGIVLRSIVRCFNWGRGG